MSFGSSKSSNDNRFARTGHATTTTYRELTPELIELFNQGLNASRPGSASVGVDPRLAYEIGQYTSGAPYQSELTNYIQSLLPGTSIGGQASLTSQANVNPYGGGFEQRTFDRYAADAQEVMAQARSGPMMNRGGTAANGYMQAQALNDISLDRERVLQGNRIADSQISQGAAGTLASVQSDRARAGLQGVALGFDNFNNNRQTGMGAVDRAQRGNSMFNELVPSFATMNSPVHGSESNDLSGRGSQTSSSMGVSGGCCFIFMEAYHGKMPKEVRFYRDMFAPESSERREGYIKMAKWLVPLMRTNEGVRDLTWRWMVKPLSDYGVAYFKGEEQGLKNRLLKGFWFKTWELIGKITTK